MLLLEIASLIGAILCSLFVIVVCYILHACIQSQFNLLTAQMTQKL